MVRMEDGLVEVWLIPQVWAVLFSSLPQGTAITMVSSTVVVPTATTGRVHLTAIVLLPYTLIVGLSVSLILTVLKDTQSAVFEVSLPQEAEKGWVMIMVVGK